MISFKQFLLEAKARDKEQLRPSHGQELLSLPHAFHNHENVGKPLYDSRYHSNTFRNSSPRGTVARKLVQATGENSKDLEVTHIGTAYIKGFKVPRHVHILHKKIGPERFKPFHNVRDSRGIYGHSEFPHEEGKALAEKHPLFSHWEKRPKEWQEN